MQYAELLKSIKQTFIDQDQYFFDKHVPEFAKDGKILLPEVRYYIVES